MADTKKDWREGLSLIGQQEYLFESGIRSDCDVLVSEREVLFCAHKTMLFRGSAVFEAMCYASEISEEKKKTVIKIKDVEPTIFHFLLRFIYTDMLPHNLSVEDLMSLWLAANKYLVYNLSQTCINQLKKQLNMKNFWNIFQFVTKEKVNGLLLETKQFLCQNTKQLFEEPSMLTISKGCMLVVLKEDQLNIKSELEVINACLIWATSKCEEQNIPLNNSNLRKILSTDIISKIRFLSLEANEFALGPGKQGWLSLEEKNEILTCMAVPNYELQNKKLCNIKESRSPSNKRKATVVENDDEIVFKKNEVLILPLCKEHKYLFKSEASTCGFLITSNSDVILQSMSFCSQTKNASIIKKNASHFSITNESQQYNEQINIDIQTDIDIKGVKSVMKLAEIKFNEAVSYGCCFSIKFPDNLKLEKDRTYKVIVTCFRIGCYNIRTLHDTTIIRTQNVDAAIERIPKEGVVALPLRSISFLSN